MKQKKLVRWEKPDSVSETKPGNLLWNAAWESLSLLVLIFVAISALSRVSAEIRLDARSNVYVTLIVLITVFVYKGCISFVLARVQNKKKKRMVGILSKGLPTIIAGGILFGYYQGHLEEIQGGFFAILEPFAREYNRLVGANELVYGADPSQISFSLCFLILCSFFALYVPFAFGKRKWQFLLLPGFATAALMFVGLAPSWGQILFMAAGAFMISKGGSTGKMAPIIGLATFFLIFGTLGLFFQPRAEGLLGHSLEVKKFEEKIEKNLKSLFSGTVKAKNESVANNPPKYKDAAVMTVRVSDQPKNNLYFKEFCGADYVDGSWISKDDQFLRQCKAQGFDPAQAVTWLLNPLSYVNVTGASEYHITYKGFLSQNMLIPYGVKADELKNVTFRGDGVAGKPKTMKEQTFNASHDVSLATFTDANQRMNVWARNHYNSLAEIEEEREFWDWYRDYVNDTYLNAPYYKNLFPEIESNYAKSMGTYGVSDYYRAEIADWIRLVMTGRNSTYSWNLDELKNGEDAIEHFLKNGRRGYCIHFASASVMLLRNYGVPARYVSGYVVQPSAFREQEDGSYVAEVIDRNAHAWVEIYLDNFGWIPVEVTPGYSGGSDLPTSEEEQRKREESEREETQQSLEESASEPEETEESEVPSLQEEPEESSEQKMTPSPKPESKEGQGGGKNGSGDDGGAMETAWKGDGVWIAGVIGFMILAFAFLLYECHRSKKRQLENALRRKYYKGATMIMNRRVYKKLRSKGMLRDKNATDRDMGRALREVFGEEKEAEIAEYLRVVKAAAFSGDSISKEECQVVWKVYRQLNKS